MDGFEAPLSVARLLDGVGAPWWIGGGWAIDLFLGRVSREHEDVDIVVLRRDQERFRTHLGPGWEWSYVPQPIGGRFLPWPADGHLDAPIHEIHASAQASGDQLELLLNDADGNIWRYRRDPRITLRLDRLGTTGTAGLPALTPEVCLLYKSKTPRTTDLADLHAALPTLHPEVTAWLRAAVTRAHPTSPYLPILEQYAGAGGAR